MKLEIGVPGATQGSDGYDRPSTKHLRAIPHNIYPLCLSGGGWEKNEGGELRLLIINLYNTAFVSNFQCFFSPTFRCRPRYKTFFLDHITIEILNYCEHILFFVLQSSNRMNFEF